MDNLIAAYLVRSNMEAERMRRRREPEAFGLRKSGVVSLFSALASVGVFAVLMDQLAR
jgi:hypothetical protein